MLALVLAAQLVSTSVATNDPLVKPTDEDCFMASVYTATAFREAGVDKNAQQAALTMAMFFNGRLSTLPGKTDWLLRVTNRIDTLPDKNMQWWESLTNVCIRRWEGLSTYSWSE